MDKSLREAALDYHSSYPAGKLSILPTKQLSNQYDLSLAYSPGVAAVCEEIAADSINAHKYTARNNLVAVISNGTAVLGLGAIGPLASKPVMEGKAVLFKKFAGIDVFDLEVDAGDPEKFIQVVQALEPSFGAINLEDIKAPECFYIEKQLQATMRIPVFHDDQHGTAIIVGAAVINWLRLTKKDISRVKVVASGAGAASLACLHLLESLGVQLKNIVVTDRNGVVYKGRKENIDESKYKYAIDTPCRTLADAIAGADIFLGLSAGGIMSQDMVKEMSEDPLILALANPNPEILPGDVTSVRDDAIIATGRSDFPNQVNNVLCFPFIFRGALDVGATCINEEMKIAAVHAIADLATETVDSRLDVAYHGQTLKFGRDYIIPKPFDPRLISRVAPTVAKAAMQSNVARFPIEDFSAYRQGLEYFTMRTGAIMKPVFAMAREAQQKNSIDFCEGENENILRAVQVVIDEDIAKPILIGRPEVVEQRIDRYSLKMKPNEDFELVNPNSDPRYYKLWNYYYELTNRYGVTRDQARSDVIRYPTLIGTLLMLLGDADGVICGIVGRFKNHLDILRPVISLTTQSKTLATLNLLILPKSNIFFCDTYINEDPGAEEIATITLMAAREIRHFGIKPIAALLSHSDFGASAAPSAVKMREALAIIRSRDPELMVDGEMQGGTALSEETRNDLYPFSRLEGSANLLIFPDLNAANISFNLLKTIDGGGVTVGPMLLGCDLPIHILTPEASVRRIVNMAALTVAKCNQRQD